MAMFGAPRTGWRSPWGTPFNPDENGFPSPDSGQTLGGVGGGQTAPTAAKPSFFGEGGAGRGIAGAIGDYLLQAGGAQPIYAPAHQQAQLMARQRQQAEAAKYAPQHVGDEIAHLDPATGRYVTDYAPQRPVHTGSIETNYDFFKSIDPTGAMAKQYATGQANPLVGVDVTQPDGSVQRNFYPRSGPAAAPQSGPAPGATDGGYRFKGGDYKDPSNWEPVGGAGPQTPRTFPGLPRRAR